jgi:hypothetical protein
MRDYLANREKKLAYLKVWREESPKYEIQRNAHVKAYRAYMCTVPWYVYVLKYAASRIMFYAGSSRCGDRLKNHLHAAMKGGTNDYQRDLRAVIRYQILVLGEKPILEKVFTKISTKKQAAALEKRTIEVLGTQLLKTGNLVNVHCNGASTPWRKHLLGPWQMET